MPKHGELIFRDLRERNLEDQMRASEQGYTGVLQMAVNELGLRVIQLEEEVKDLKSSTMPAKIVEADPED